MHKYQQYRERAAAAVEARNVIRKACEIGSSGKESFLRRGRRRLPARLRQSARNCDGRPDYSTNTLCIFKAYGNGVGCPFYDLGFANRLQHNEKKSCGMYHDGSYIDLDYPIKLKSVRR